jgi:hypothetical protein
MQHFSYASIPTPEQFQHDSSVSFAFRKNDIILSHIDWILQRYKMRVRVGNEPLAVPILSHLFLTSNFWIKSFHEGNSNMLKGRYPAVLAVFEASANALCTLLACNRGSLALMIEEIFGRDMHTHGFQVDHDSKRAYYMDKSERQLYRVRFKGGLAYQYPSWNTSAPMRLMLANSKKVYVPINRKGTNGQVEESSKNFGCFVMTLERELYMFEPLVGAANSQSGMFHSSFNGGDVVTMAGSMLIKNGKILGIRSDSGHYKPSHMNMAFLLEALAMYAVDLKRIRLYDFDNTELGNGFEFLKARMSWSEFQTRRRDERAHRITSEEERKRRGLPSRFPHLPGRAPAPPPRAMAVVPPQLLDEDPASLYQTT